MTKKQELPVENVKFVIMGTYDNNTEEIDEFDNHMEAEKMLHEYRIAYSNDWQLWLKVVKA